MKDWILYNWKVLPWGIALTVFCVGMILFNDLRNKKEPEQIKVKEYCLDLVKKLEGIELDPQDAKLVPIGARAKSASYSGVMMVWEKNISGISVKCSIISRGNRVKYFAVNGEDKTILAIREEREK